MNIELLLLKMLVEIDHLNKIKHNKFLELAVTLLFTSTRALLLKKKVSLFSISIIYLYLHYFPFFSKGIFKSCRECV